MAKFFEMIQFIAAVACPVSIMGFAAFLIYKQTPGWGWYLVAATLLCGSMSFRVD